MKRPAKIFIAYLCNQALLAAFGSVLWLQPIVCAAENNGKSPSYSARLWQTADGMPGDWVSAICQTRDGYLWVGTQEGLARFDGVRFTVFDSGNTPELAASFITALAEGHDHSLWIGTKSGVVRLKDGMFTRFATGNDWAGMVVRTLYCASDGTLWIGTISGVSRFKNGRIEMLSQDPADRMDVKAICEDRSGNIYFGTGADLKVLRNGVVESLKGESDPLSEARAMHLDSAGKLWIGTHRRLIEMLPENPSSFQTLAGLSHTIVTVLHEDRLGNLWIGTHGGLNRLAASDGNVAEIQNEGDSFDLINAIHEDREGNLWVGMRDGLVRLRQNSFSTYTKKDGLNHNNVVSVIEDRAGALWAGTWGGGLNKFEDGRFSVFHQPKEIMIMGLCEDRDGSLWFSRDLPGGLMRVAGTNLVYYGPAQGFDTAGRVIRQTRSGIYWIGGRNALYSFDGETFTPYTVQEGLAGNDIRDIREDRNGRLWIATGSGLSVRREDQFVSFTQQDGLPGGPIYCIHEDETGLLWFGTKAGLRIFKNDRFVAITSDQGLVSDTVFAIVEDDDAQLWMSSPSGVFAAPKNELEAAAGNPGARVTCTSYDEQDGLATTRCSFVAQPSAWKTRDGRIWFATAKGLSVINPRQAPPSRPLPPPVVIEQVIADKKVQSLKFKVQRREESARLSETLNVELGTLNLPPGRGELEFHFTALSFRAPEKNRFKYKLEGVDSDWVDAGTSRVAHYQNVPPGNYRFRVIAGNNDGVWNETGAALAFIMAPHFWQTKWFVGLMALTMVGLAAGAARHVTWKTAQRKLSRLEQQHAIDKERARIAQDMHDDLGTRLTEIMLASHRAKNSRGVEPERHRHLDRITDVSRELVDNLDAIVWAVNPGNDSLDKLVLYISEFAGPFLEAASIRYRLVAPNPLPDCALSSEARHNLFLAVKEALNNAVKHSGASEVRICVAVNDKTLSLSIEDNGGGFSSPSSAFGNGLFNMKKRVENIGGSFLLQSRPANGTRIQMQMPIKRKV